MTEAHIAEYDHLLRSLVGSLRRKYCKHVPWIDAMQTGYASLAAALKTFDPEHGTNFSSYLYTILRNSLWEESRNYRLIHVPACAWKASEGRNKEKGIAAQIVRRLATFEQEDILDKSTITTVDNYLDVEELLQTLPQEDRYLIKSIYGIGVKKRTLQELGQYRRITRQAIHLQRQRILDQLRRQVRTTKTT